MEFEFKGTRGKWEVKKYWTDNEIEIGTSEQPCCALIDRRYFQNETEAQYNALLISKAPEMVEFIKKYYRYLNIEDQEKAEQLLKSATELT